jgi:hypothetical protein
VRVKVNITIDQQVFDELEKLRNTKIASKTFLEDRSRTYEKLLILGMAEEQRTAQKLKILEKLRFDKLNLERVDLERLGL